MCSCVCDIICLCVREKEKDKQTITNLDIFGSQDHSVFFVNSRQTIASEIQKKCSTNCFLLIRETLLTKKWVNLFRFSFLK
jgi:hypothetical protein